MPVYVMQMKRLESDDPILFAELVNGNFVVAKSNVPNTALFIDQNLEQKIK